MPRGIGTRFGTAAATKAAARRGSSSMRGSATRMIHNDKEALDEITGTQQQNADALRRIQQQLEETTQVGNMTLEDLYEQRRQIEAIADHGDRLHDNLDETEELTNKLKSFVHYYFLPGGGLIPKMGSSGKMLTVDPPAVATSNTNDDNDGYQQGAKPKWKLSVAYHKKRQHEKQRVFQSKERQAVVAKDDISPHHEYKKEFDAIADADEELDRQLDAIGAQLDGLVLAAEEMGAEIKAQEQGLQHIRGQVVDADYRQQELNQQTRHLIGNATKDRQRHRGGGFSAMKLSS